MTAMDESSKIGFSDGAGGFGSFALLKIYKNIVTTQLYRITDRQCCD